MKKIVTFTIVLVCSFLVAFAEDLKTEEIQRMSLGVFDGQENTVSNIQFSTTNFGIVFFDISQNTSSGIWPRGSKNQYIYASGIWFAAKKQVGDSINKLCEITYNTNSGRSWTVPGRIDDGNAIDKTQTDKYRVYFSTDMNPIGSPINIEDGSNWPLWIPDDPSAIKLGTYVNDIEDRQNNTYHNGPAFFSDEDIFCTYKDTDLNYFDGGADERQGLGYPFGLQWEQTICDLAPKSGTMS
ncbi:MAG: hypothetical protein PF588_03035 [Candidatus Kapabacteria bacterium]|nr:hypothetical protein [Candidatus Kapabacteria bacterium]